MQAPSLWYVPWSSGRAAKDFGGTTQRIVGQGHEERKKNLRWLQGWTF